MKINDFIQNFANQFDETDASEFQATTEFRQLDEWSSLSSLAIISMIDDEYDVVINGNDLRNCNTIEDLFAIPDCRGSGRHPSE